MRSRFVKVAMKLLPFMTCESVGDPDPTKRSASVVFAFYGSGALEKAHKLHDAIIADVTAARPKPETGE